MKDKRFLFNTNGILFFILAYAPWHDALFLGQRPKLSTFGISFLSGLTTSGLFNIICLCLVSILFLWRWLPSVIYKTKISLLEILVLAWPVYSVARIEFFSSAALVFVGNSIVLSFLFLIFLRKKYFMKEINFLRTWGLLILTVSYFFALSLPFLFPVEGYSVFAKLGPIYRYRGWLGEGQPIGFLGLVICVWSSVQIVLNKKISYLTLFALVLGMTGIYSNVLRIALLSVVVFYLAVFISLVFYFDGESKKLKSLFFTLICCSFLMFFSGNFLKKSIDGGYIDPDTHDSGPSSLTKVYGNNQHLEKIVLEKDLRRIDAFIVTNHRAVNFEILWRNSKHKRLFGIGTGGSKSVLEKEKSAITVLGSDYMRIFIELGVVGLIFFFAINIVIVTNQKDPLLLSLMIAYWVVLSTDVFLILPAFGYVPLFFAGFSIMSDMQKS